MSMGGGLGVGPPPPPPTYELLRASQVIDFSYYYYDVIADLFDNLPISTGTFCPSTYNSAAAEMMTSRIMWLDLAIF
jgi:hypothetical protein